MLCVPVNVMSVFAHHSVSVELVRILKIQNAYQLHRKIRYKKIESELNRIESFRDLIGKGRCVCEKKKVLVNKKVKTAAQTIKFNFWKCI